ncbi:MAG: GNAT family N-acetyltransferase [Bacteroidia bacterium]|nr:GNAT family N-acetyltransferase [Bacteroidia bacterium]
MNIHYSRATSAQELKQILELQTINLRSVISTNESRKEGFVSVVHTLDLLERMNTAAAHILAKEGEKVVGYALCMHPAFADEIPMLKPMFKRVNEQVGPHYKFMIMGQICIGKQYREKGIFRELYKAMAAALFPAYESIITEVDTDNQRSLQAHYAIGFEEMEVYRSGGRQWHLIQLKNK